MDDLLKSLEDLVRTKLFTDDPSRALDQETSLLGEALDSFQIMTLALEIEKRFSIDVRPKDIVPENFATVRSLAKLVESRMRRPEE